MNDNILYHALADSPSRHTARTPPFSLVNSVSPDRPTAVQGAKRRSVPLTARTDLQSSVARERGFKKQ